jgi:hypothetical protein
VRVPGAPTKAKSHAIPREVIEKFE